jgi:adenosylhomocysteine nucleosidase
MDWDVVVMVSANIEWQTLDLILPDVHRQRSPFGEYFALPITVQNRAEPLRVLFVHGGWGKISAAASAQYALSRWQPRLLVNLGTCGGFEGKVERGALILAEKTVVYDIYEQMGDAQEHLDHYTTHLDLSWLEGADPQDYLRTTLVSGDRDLFPDQIEQLHAQFGAVAGDWESGAIAWVASRNHTPCLILRGVSDLVGPGGGEAYGGLEIFRQAAEILMRRLLQELPDLLGRAAAFTAA